jgi:hypothetical protein
MSKCRKVANSVLIECPGCDSTHSIDLARWTWNGDTQKPTFHPSLHLTITYGSEPKKKYVCHSFVVEGKIAYLQDTTHQYSGQTIDLPDC